MALRNGVSRTHSIKESVLRRFHRELTVLKAECESKCLVLKSYESADETDICVLSINDYALMEPKSNCTSEDESYFMSESDYVEYSMDEDYD